MTEKEIVRLAEEAELWLHSDRKYEAVKKFAELVAAAEREACIKLLEDFSQTTMVPVVDTWRMGLIAGANALRARGER